MAKLIKDKTLIFRVYKTQSRDLKVETDEKTKNTKIPNS